jgi:hypothetical protein
MRLEDPSRRIVAEPLPAPVTVETAPEPRPEAPAPTAERAPADR